MGRNTHSVTEELQERLPKSVEAYNGIFHGGNTEMIHVIVCEDEVGQFYKAVREMDLEPSVDSWRTKAGRGAVRGYVYL